MDTAILSAAAALAGSLVGGVSTFAASWLTHRGRLRAEELMHEARKREAVYAEFITEASQRLTEAWSHHAEDPAVIAGLYAAVQRMQLSSSDAVVRIAHQVVRQVLEAYAAPDKSFEELRREATSEDSIDPLREFSEACRVELRDLRS